MPRYLISFDARAMDHIPDEDMPAVTNASLAVVQEAINAGVWVFGGGLENQKASIVATDGRVTDGPYPESKAIGGLWSSTYPHARRRWSGLPGSPSPAAVLKMSGSSCLTHDRSRQSLEGGGFGAVATRLRQCAGMSPGAVVTARLSA